MVAAVRLMPVKNSIRCEFNGVEPLWMKGQGRDAYLAIGQELDPLATTMRGHHLILAAYGFLQSNLLHMDGFVRQPFLPGMAPFSA